MSKAEEKRAAAIVRAEQRAARDKRLTTRKLKADRQQRKEAELQRKLSQPYLLAPLEITWRDRLFAVLVPILIVGFLAFGSLMVIFGDRLP